LKIKANRLSGYLDWIKNGLTNPKLLIFVFFLFVSVVFWLINSLGEKYTAKISYPVKFVNYSANKVLITELPEKISVYGEAIGYTLLKAKLNAGLKPVIIDFNRYNLQQTSYDTNIFFINTRHVVEDVERQLNADIAIRNISPDTICLHYSKKSSKTVPVHLSLMIDYRKPFMRTGKIDIQPDSVFVTGPYRMLDTVTLIETEHKKLMGVDETQKFTVKLKTMKHVNLSANSVNVTIPVEQFTEAQLTVPVDVLNEPEGVEVKLFPNSVKITCMVALSNYKKINENDFDIIVYYDSIDNSIENNKLEINSLGIPEYIKQYKFSPEHVEYIIEK